MSTFRELFTENLGGLMGGDQRNRRSGSVSPSDDEIYNGKSLKIPFDPDYGKQDWFTNDINRYAKENNVTLEQLKYNNILKITGSKGNIKKFLKASGMKPKQYNPYF